jgi:two-component system, sensor histidine kinase
MHTDRDAPRGGGGGRTAERTALFRAEQIRAQYGNTPGAFIGSAIVASLVAAILCEKLPRTTVLAWLGVAYLWSALRWLLWVAYRRAQPSAADMPRWGARLAVAALFSGLLWGFAGAAFYLPGSLSYELFLLVVTLGLTFVSAYISAPYLPAFNAFAYPTFILSSLPFFMAGVLNGDTPRLALACLVLFVLLPLMRRYAALQSRAFFESLDLKLRNAELLDELRAQKSAAEEANIAKSRFLAVASHDLRQPLHALSLLAEALHEAKLPPHERHIVANVRRTVDVMEELFDELLDISRLDAGVITARVETFALAPVLDRLRMQYAPIANRKGLSLRVRSTAICVRSDPILLARILGNLLANAIRYTDRGGIVLGCRRERDGARIEVWDTGHGIPADKHAEVFQEFAQLENASREPRKGLGLGLAIVARLAQLLEHRVGLRSAPGKGSLFAVSLPRARAEDCVVEFAATLDLSAVLALVIDDEPEVRHATAALLGRWNCQVISAGSSAEMMARLDTVPKVPDLIVCDYRLGDDDNGAALIRRLRGEFNSDIPAVLVTGAAQLIAGDLEREAANDPGGALPVLYKPLNPARLRTLIVNLLKESRARRAPEDLISS